jgi:hypothetical protein
MPLFYMQNEFSLQQKHPKPFSHITSASQHPSPSHIQVHLFALFFLRALVAAPKTSCLSTWLPGAHSL